LSTTEMSPSTKRPAAPKPADPFVARPDNTMLEAIRDGQQLIVRASDGSEPSWWSIRERSGELTLESAGPCSGDPSEHHLLAALEATFIDNPLHERLTLSVSIPLPRDLVRTGTVALNAGAPPTVSRQALWQQPRLWIPDAGDSFALHYTLTQGRRHPHRPPKPVGTVYRRYIPWLAKTLSLRAIDPERDLPTFSCWMNDPVVAHFWQEEGDLAKHCAYLETITADPHTISLIGCFDDQPFGYFEVYWGKEDRIAPFYDVHDFDRGWHVLIGEPRFRGRSHLTAWMPSVSHYLFLDDCRTQRIVIEPRIDNHKMIKSLGRSGYALLKEFDFPHKRAVLGMLLRERFFGEALWIPQEVSGGPLV
jgi:acetyl CoA:N6-hydroxylysine acetyl transferase